MTDSDEIERILEEATARLTLTRDLTDEAQGDLEVMRKLRAALREARKELEACQAAFEYNYAHGGALPSTARQMGVDILKALAQEK